MKEKNLSLNFTFKWWWNLLIYINEKKQICKFEVLDIMSSYLFSLWSVPKNYAKNEMKEIVLKSIVYSFLINYRLIDAPKKVSIKMQSKKKMMLRFFSRCFSILLSA